MNRKNVGLFLLLSFVFSVNLVFAAESTISSKINTSHNKKVNKKNRNTARLPHKKTPHSVTKPAERPKIISVKAPARVKIGKGFTIEIKARAGLGLKTIQIDFAGKKSRLSAKGKKSCTLKAKLKSNHSGKQSLTITAIDKKNNHGTTHKKTITVFEENKPPQVTSVKAPPRVKAGTEFSIEIKARADLGLSIVRIDFAGKKIRLSGKGKKSCVLKTKLKSNKGGRQTLTITAIDKKNHHSTVHKKNIMVLAKSKPPKVGSNHSRRTTHLRNTASILKNKPPIVNRISAPISVSSGQSVPVQYTLSDDKGLQAMLVTAWGQKKIIKLRGRTAKGTFKLTAGKPGTAALKIMVLDSDNLKSREITRMVKVRAKHVVGNDHSKPVRSIHQTQHSIGVAGSPSKRNPDNSFSGSVKQNPFSTVDVPADIGKGRRSLGSSGKDLGRQNDIGGRLPAGIQNSDNGFGTSGGASGYAVGIGKTEETIGNPEEEFADQMKPTLVTGQGAQREEEDPEEVLNGEKGSTSTDPGEMNREEGRHTDDVSKDDGPNKGDKGIIIPPGQSRIIIGGPSAPDSGDKVNSTNDDDEENDNGGDGDTAGGRREIAGEAGDGSANGTDARWINQDRVKDTLANAPGGAGTTDYAPGEEGGTAGESGIGPGNFKDMDPSQVHTFDGADAISHNFENLNQKTQSVIKDGGPATAEIHSAQD